MKHLTTEEMLAQGIIMPVEQETDKECFIVEIDGKKYKVPFRQDET